MALSVLVSIESLNIQIVRNRKNVPRSKMYAEVFQTVTLKMEELIVLAFSGEVIHTVILKASCVVMRDVMTYYKDVKSTIICLFVSADIWKSCNLVIHIH